MVRLESTRKMLVFFLCIYHSFTVDGDPGSQTNTPREDCAKTFYAYEGKKDTTQNEKYGRVPICKRLEALCTPVYTPPE